MEKHIHSDIIKTIKNCKGFEAGTSNCDNSNCGLTPQGFPCGTYIYRCLRHTIKKKEGNNSRDGLESILQRKHR